MPQPENSTKPAENHEDLDSPEITPQTTVAEQGIGLAPSRLELAHQEGISETKELAKLLELIENDNPEEIIATLTDYFKIKQLNGLFQFEQDPQKLSQEIWSIEEKIRSIKTPDNMPDAPKIIRESLIATVLSGKVSAKAILDRLNGEITISNQAGKEVGNYTNPEKLAAFFTVESGVSSLYLYDNALSEDPEHHFQHELGHIFAETGAIWDQEIFLDFLQAVAEMDDAKIAQIGQQAPELAAIYNLIKNPDQAIFFRPYIKEKLSKLGSLDQEQLPQARITAAKEIIAEMTSFYLESANDELSYFNIRLKYLGGDAIELCKQMLTPERFDQFKEQYDLEGRKLTAAELFEFIKSTPEFQSDLLAQKKIIEKMQVAFENRGENIKPMSEMTAETAAAYADEDLGDLDQLYFRSSTGGISGGDHDFSLSGGGGTQTESPLSLIWEIATGQKESFKTPFSQ